MKLRVVLVAVLSVVASALITYRPSISPPRLTPRVAAFGVAQSLLLGDTKDSPLADSQVLTDDIDLLAANLAEVGDSPAILNPVPASVGVSPSKVAVSEQLVQNVAFSQSNSQEAQVGNQISGDARHYAMLLRVDPQSFVIQIFTQAPAGTQSIRMANATAISQYVANLVTNQHVPLRRQIIMRQVVGAYGGDVDNSLTLAVTALLAVASLSWCSHLLFGRGYGSFDPFKYRILDNQMLGWLVEIGVVGALAYAGVMAGAIVSVARVARRGVGSAKRLMQSVVAVSVGFFVSNFLYDTFGFRQAPYIFFFVAALGVACVSDPVAPQSVGETAELTAPTRVHPRRRFPGEWSARGT
jgi:hypothetical protein